MVSVTIFKNSYWLCDAVGKWILSWENALFLFIFTQLLCYVCVALHDPLVSLAGQNEQIHIIFQCSWVKRALTHLEHATYDVHQVI